MATTLTDEDIAYLREVAASAETYPYDHEVFQWFDGGYTEEEKPRVRATMARYALEKAGIPLEPESGKKDN